jgi:CheY-like chemotaxis protein
MSTALLKDRTVLVVEDDEDTRELLRFVLQESGANVLAVGSVDAALGKYRQSPPHAVIADIRLGRSDGYALIKAIRDTDAEYRGFTPVIAVTGFASPDDEERAMASGFNAYITKPFDPAEVVTTLGKLLNSSGDLAA